MNQNIPIPKNRKPTHPGHFIKKYILSKEKVTQGELATLLDITRSNLVEVINERRGISIQMARRLGKLVQTGPRFWLNLQNTYDLWIDELEGSDYLKNVRLLTHQQDLIETAL